MFGLTDYVGRATLRAASIATVCLLAMSAGALGAKAETRTLKFYNLHTKEKVSIAYKKNGRYSADGLKQINWFMRDWRRKEPTKMDTRLLDLIWEAYRQSGSRDYIHVICGYRAPATNSMLRSRSSGVAKESQHTQGRALDFYIPDVSLKKVREIGLKMQAGGVGYYPRSGSPFVHFDVGNARHWPRMSRKELVAVFPKGNTIHVPSDGKPLPGYEQALASYKSRKGASAIQVANASASSAKSGGGKTLLAALFGGGSDEEEDIADVEVAAQDKKKPPVAAPKVREQAAPKREEAVAVAAMVPTAKPNLLAAGVPLPIRDTFDTGVPTPPAGLQPAAVEEATEVAALDLARIPLPRSAPVRPTLAPELPETAAPAEDNVSALVAALESSPTADDSAGVAGQMAYAVPTPRDRPPFESILKEAEVPPVLAAQGPTEDQVKRIVTASSAMRAEMASLTTSAAVSATAERASETVAAKTVQKEAPSALVLAALESPRKQPVQSARPMRSAHPLPVRVPVPTGKTGRFKKAEAEIAAIAAPQPQNQSTILSRIEVATLVGDPNQLAADAVTKKPKADVLVRDIPTAVFTAGFASGSHATKSDRFIGSAVNFLPIAKFE